MTNKGHLSVNGRKFNWSELYGKLGSGEYEFILSDYSDTLPIRILFNIDLEGTITYKIQELQ